MHMHHDTLPCACTALRKASRAVTRLYDDALAPHGLTTTQFAILRSLARAGDLPLARLAERLVMDRTSLYRTIAPIERAGWIALADGAGRNRVASLTAQGTAALRAAEPAWERAQAQVTGHIDAGEWQALQATLDRLIAAARA